MRALALLPVLVGTLATAPAQGATRHCAAVPATVHYERAADADLACAGAEKAVRFFAGLGFRADTPITIHIVDAPTVEVAEGYNAPVHGRFNARTNQIYVAAFANGRPPGRPRRAFRLPFDGDMQRGFVVHEVAHAIVERNFEGDDRPHRVAHEYIAYAAQIATLPPALRARLLDRYRVQGFPDEDAIAPLAHALDPNLFGVRAYLHFSAPENGVRFLRHLLSGRFAPNPWY